MGSKLPILQEKAEFIRYINRLKIEGYDKIKIDTLVENWIRRYQGATFSGIKKFIVETLDEEGIKHDGIYVYLKGE